MKLTIKDIARLSGVSTATVSMIVNKKDGRISSETRNRVLRIIKENGYVPNRIASSMVTKRTKTLGLVIPDIVNPFFPEIARGVEDKANAEGYTVILCNSDNNMAKEDSYIDMFQKKMVDGIIFTASSRRTKVSTELKKLNMPIITVDRDIEGLKKQGKIIVDNAYGAYDAVKKMLLNGRKNIYHLSGPMTSKTTRDRYDGYLKAHKELDIKPPKNHLLEGKYISEWGYEAILDIVANNKEFDGIFCGNDMIAFGALKGLRENNISVPKQVSVVGFDDIYMSKMVTPELTTVKQPKYEMGHKAADMLIKMIKGEPIEKYEWTLKTSFIKRGSTL